MRRLVLPIIILLVVAAGFAFAISRGGGDEQEDTPAGASPAPSSTPIESKENKLPAGFPSDLPIPKYDKIVYSVESVPKENKTYLVFFASSSSPDEIKRSLVAELSKKGWRITGCNTAATSPEPITTVAAVKDKLSAQIWIGYVPQVAEQRKIEPFSFFYTVSTVPSAMSSAPPTECP